MKYDIFTQAQSLVSSLPLLSSISGVHSDVAVGAPYFTDYSLSGQYEHGAVYIYYGTEIAKVSSLQ